MRGGIAPGDSVYRSFDKALMDILKREAARDNKKLLVRGRFLAVLGKPAELELSYNGIIARQSGGLCEPAKSQPMTAADIERQLSKTGGTSFEISFEDSHAETGIFINKAELNALRRAAVSELEEGIRAGRRRVAGYAPALPERIREYVAAPLLTALTRNREQFDAVIDTGGLARVYMECTDDLLNNPGYYASRGRARGVEVFAALPQIWDDGEDHIIAALENSPLAGWLARSFGSLAALGKSAKPKVADYTFNVTNTLAYDFFAAQAGTVCFSPEAGVAAISAAADKRAEIIAHGRQNMMTTRQCPVGIFAANKGSGKFCRLRDGAGTYALEDERGVKFPVLTDCGRCVAHIFNDRPVCMLHRIKELDKTRAGFYRISLSTEGAGEAAAIVRAYAAAMKGQDSPEARALDAEMEQTGFTYGYFFKEPQKNKKR